MNMITMVSIFSNLTINPTDAPNSCQLELRNTGESTINTHLLFPTVVGTFTIGKPDESEPRIWGMKEKSSGGTLHLNLNIDAGKAL